MTALSFSPNFGVNTATVLHSSSHRLPPELEALGVQSERWNVNENIHWQHSQLEGGFLDKNLTPAFIKECLGNNADQERRIYDLRTTEGNIDLVEFSCQTPGIKEWRALLGKPHFHSSSEIQLILAGRGVLNIHTAESNWLIDVKKGDLFIVPELVTHSFTLVEEDSVTILRVFPDQRGWVPRDPKFNVVSADSENIGQVRSFKRLGVFDGLLCDAPEKWRQFEASH
jgi:cupin superfamily acireductone dioxygenase involved in methionine salvage